MKEEKYQSMMEEGYLEMETNQKLVMNLRDAGHMLRFLYEGKGSQKRILMILSEENGMTQRTLTERIGIQPGSVSEVLGKLELAGLIERKANDSDRRTTNIYLTDKGIEEAKTAKKQREIRHQEMFECFDDEQKQTLLMLLEKLNQDWNHRYQHVKYEREHHSARAHRHHNH